GVGGRRRRRLRLLLPDSPGLLRLRPRDEGGGGRLRPRPGGRGGGPGRLLLHLRGVVPRLRQRALRLLGLHGFLLRLLGHRSAPGVTASCFVVDRRRAATRRGGRTAPSTRRPPPRRRRRRRGRVGRGRRSGSG